MDGSSLIGRNQGSRRNGRAEQRLFAPFAPQRANNARRVPAPSSYRQDMSKTSLALGLSVGPNGKGHFVRSCVHAIGLVGDAFPAHGSVSPSEVGRVSMSSHIYTLIPTYLPVRQKCAPQQGYCTRAQRHARGRAHQHSHFPRQDRAA
jgi:hypothetical protein